MCDILCLYTKPRVILAQLAFSSFFRLITINTMHTMNPRATMGPVVLTACTMNEAETSWGVRYAGSETLTVSSLIC